jgi:zinc D-Ala-D-Ala dipeptidase
MIEPSAAADSRSDPPLALRHAVPQILSCRQLIIVTTKGWNDMNASVRLLERATVGHTPWREVGDPVPAVIGTRGFAWGVGLHGTGQTGAPSKKEGDQRSPAGVFKLFAVFGTANPDRIGFLRFPYEQVTSTTEAIDDPHSRHYNRIVDRVVIKHPDWSSSESMVRVGGRYRLGVMIEHNWSQIPGLGSCIFLHVWSPDRGGTAGCTAVSLANLKRLLYRLDAEKNPLIVQLPLPEYDRLKQAWELP